jgi:hypothetical protein
LTISTAESDVVLSAEEQQILAGEVAAFAAALRDPQTRARYAELAAAVGDGTVPAELTGPLETMLELLLQTPEPRRRWGAPAEAALLDLLYRLPRGRELKRSVHAVNAGLSSLSGQVLRSMRFSPLPGGQRLLVRTDDCELALTIDRGGVRLERLEV